MKRLGALELSQQSGAKTLLLDVRVQDTGTFLRCPKSEARTEHIMLFRDYTCQLALWVSAESNGWQEFSDLCHDLVLFRGGDLAATEESYSTLQRNTTAYFSSGLGPKGEPGVYLKGWEDPFVLGGRFPILAPPRDAPVVETPKGWKAERDVPWIARSLEDGAWMVRDFYGNWQRLVEFQQTRDAGLDLMPLCIQDGMHFHLVKQNLATAHIGRVSIRPEHSGTGKWEKGGEEVRQLNGMYIPFPEAVNARIVEYIREEGWVKVGQEGLFANPNAIALLGRFLTKKDEEGLVIMSNRPGRGPAFYRCSGEALELL